MNCDRCGLIVSETPLPVGFRCLCIKSVSEWERQKDVLWVEEKATGVRLYAMLYNYIVYESGLSTRFKKEGWLAFFKKQKMNELDLEILADFLGQVCYKNKVSVASILSDDEIADFFSHDQLAELDSTLRDHLGKDFNLSYNDQSDPLFVDEEGLPTEDDYSENSNAEVWLFDDYDG